MRAGLIFDRAPFERAHASSIAETEAGIVTVWYARDSETEVGDAIWLSIFDGRRWTRPRKVGQARRASDGALLSWNPVLFQPERGPLLLFYRVGPNPREWRTVVQVSADGGLTWSEPVGIPEGYLGPIRTKPVQLSNKDIVMGSSTEHDGWVVHIERFSFPQQSHRTPVDRWTNQLASPEAWTKTEPLHSLRAFAAIQPALVVHDNELLQILCRTKQEVISESWSSDGGHTWSPMVSSGLPNPNAGIDATRLRDGRYLLASNPTTSGRSKLSVLVSDNGIDWDEAFVLESTGGEHSYPAIIQAGDGSVHITYSWNRSHIKHVRLDPELLTPFGADSSVLWPKQDDQQ